MNKSLPDSIGEPADFATSTSLSLTASREIKNYTFRKITLSLAAVLIAAPAFAQFSITVGHPRPEPVCTYGYYDYAPYECAPQGFYGPEFFVGGHYHPRRAWSDHQRDTRGRNNGYRSSRSRGANQRDQKGHGR